MTIFFLGGEGGIRTLGTIADTTVFKTVPLNHSGTSPAEPIITDTDYLVESLAGNCRHPHAVGTGLAQRLGRILHRRTGRHHIVYD